MTDMPEFVEFIIKSLSPTQADKLWEWLDADPEAINKLIRLAAERADEEV